MESKFTFIKDIQDETFLEHFRAGENEERGLYEQCIEIENDYRISRYNVCLGTIRPLSEKLIKYVYCRLFGEEWRRSSIFILIGNDQDKVSREIDKSRNPKKMQKARERFRDEVTNTFLREADAIRDQGNETIHNDDNENDLKREAERAIDSLAYLIKEAVEIIQSSGETDGTKKAIEGKVSIEQKQDDDGKEILKVKVENANFRVYEKEQKNNQFKWIVLGKGSRREYSFPGGPILTLKKENYGRQFVCEIFRPDMVGSISNADAPHEVKHGDKKQEKSPKKMTGKVEVECKQDMVDGQTFLVLTASPSDFRENEEYIYTWYLKGNEEKRPSGRRGQYIEKNTGNNELRIRLEEYEGKSIICMVTHKEWNGSIFSELVSVQAETDMGDSGSESKDEKEEPGQEMEVPVNSEETSVMELPEPFKEDEDRKEEMEFFDGSKEEKSAEDIPERISESVPTDKVIEETSAKDILDILPPTVFLVRYKDEISMRFEASEELRHYFVRPNDIFALNSLELLDADVYLYRLLKFEGYKNILFFSYEKDWFVKAYDDSSMNVVRKQNAIEEQKNPEKTLPMGLTGNVKKKGVANQKKTGRIILSSAQEFTKFFSEEVYNALSAPGTKTAIVMPMRILRNDGYLNDRVIDSIRNLRVKHGSNILVFTLDSREEFGMCSDGRQQDIHNFPVSILNLMRKDIMVDIVGESIDRLSRKHQIVLADRPGVDEIANVLIRSVLTDGNMRLEGLRAEKIYPLAEMIRDYYLYGEYKDRFKELKKEDVENGCIGKLYDILKKSASVTRELVEISEQLKPARVGFTKKINPLCLERVYSEMPARYESNTREEVEREFENYVGEEMKKVKEQIFELAEDFIDERDRIRNDQESGQTIKDDGYPNMNMVFVGNPGTGKTSIAKLTARYLKARGILPMGRYRYINAGKQVEGIVSNTAANIRRAAEEAVGGVLFVDEFQGFYEGHSAGNMGESAMRAFVDIVNEHRKDMCIIVAGYREGVNKVFEFDEGAARRFPNKVIFEDYSTETILKIFDRILIKRRESIDMEARDLLAKKIEMDKKALGIKFGNGGYVNDILLPPLRRELRKRRRGDGSMERCYGREDVLKAFPDLSKARPTAEEVLSEFDRYTGKEMQDVKTKILRAVDLFEDEKQALENRKKQGKKVQEDEMPYMNMVFLGGPGTGKTSIAKLTAKYMNAKGILPTGNYKYVTASQLVKGVVGETAAAIKQVAQEAAGGVLFIDEFQGFHEGHSGGNMAESAMRALVTLVNDHREDLCIILAGYKDGVDAVLQYDDGGGRRFPGRIEFSDYSVETLMELFDQLLDEREETIEADARAMLYDVIRYDKKRLKKSFGNGGYVKDILRKGLAEQRVVRDRTSRNYIRQDVELAFAEQLKGINGKKKTPYAKVPKSLFENLTEPYESAEKTFEGLQNETDQAVLYITTSAGNGTGFLIHPDGYALTCYHVIRDSLENSLKDDIKARVRIKGRRGGDDSYHTCEVVNISIESDMVLLKLNGSNFPYLTIAPENPADRDIKKGEEFILSGYPFGQQTKDGLSKYRGSISTGGEHKDSSGNTIYLLQTEAKSGNSGSPVISFKDGRVIGILRGALDSKTTPDKVEEINYMRPVYYFWNLFTR